MRRAAAYRAYYEHMPPRAQRRPDAGGAMLMQSRVDFGGLVASILLDDRHQYRSPHPCAERGRNGARLQQCATRAIRTMLGAEQVNGSLTDWARARRAGNVLAQRQTLIAPFEHRAADGGYDVWTDGRDGCRRRTLAPAATHRGGTGSKRHCARRRHARVLRDRPEDRFRRVEGAAGRNRIRSARRSPSSDRRLRSDRARPCRTIRISAT